jgi:hypothetical protein
MLNRIMKAFGYVRAPKVQPAKTTATKKEAPLKAHQVNAEVRDVLTRARNYYKAHGDVIVSTDLQCYMDSFEEILLHSANDGTSVETAKLLGLTWEPNATTKG